MQIKFRIPEILFGALLAVAVFAMGMMVESSRQQLTTQDSPTNPSHGSGIVSPKDSENKTTDWLLVIFNGLLFGSTVLLWNANNRSAKIAERTLVDLERAFVFIDGFNYELTTLADAGISEDVMEGLPPSTDRSLYVTRFAVQPRWKNSGNTPTREMKIQVDCILPGSVVTDDYRYKVSPDPFFIAPKAIEVSETLEMPGANALIQNGMPFGLVPLMFIYGRATYDDIFGKCHCIEWCYRISFERHDRKALRAHFIQWGEYNRSYETSIKN